MSTIETTQFLTLTDRAAAKIQGLLSEESEDEISVLRVAVQGGGCSGFQYALGFDRGPQDGDHELHQHGVTIVVDPYSAPYLQGASIDYLDSITESGFKIDNPNAASSCGCGHSFQVEDGDEHEHGAGGGCGSGACGSH
jgi:iron-sulfur cluster assembly protein